MSGAIAIGRFVGLDPDSRVGFICEKYREVILWSSFFFLHSAMVKAIRCRIVFIQSLWTVAFLPLSTASMSLAIMFEIRFSP
jgi:hypothetical protein